MVNIDNKNTPTFSIEIFVNILYLTLNIESTSTLNIAREIVWF